MLIEDYDKRSLEDQLKSLGFIPTIYSPDYSLVNEELIKKCHAQNIKVIPWTVNDKKEIERLKQIGVNGLITDYPDLFQK
jgi:glycerophosphoryl diester phosphodiesterase